MPLHRAEEDRVTTPCLVGLTVVTGIIDAVSFLGLGHIFTANMTGNVVFLGFALGGGTGVSPLRSITALGAFACGGVLGGRINTRELAAGPSLLAAMCVESLLLGVAAASTMVPGFGASSGAYAVIVLTAVAMGLRNAVVRKLGVPDLTTTVLTMTVTGLAADSRLARGHGVRRATRVLSIIAMGIGAASGAVLLRRSGLSVAIGVAALAVAGLSLFLYVRLRQTNGERIQD
ncbi:MAG: hypothetical protein JWL71_4015 [Acidobacteria bacterium]|nr:hypothetical protein [Acidobacteriota bacterium]